MNINQVTTDKATLGLSAVANQYRPVTGIHSTNSVFRRDSLSLGSVDSPHQIYSLRSVASAYSATSATQTGTPFNIRNYYSMPPEDVKPMLMRLVEELRGADYSGMTGLEICERVADRFTETFGEDFMIAEHLIGILEVSGTNLSEADKTSSNYAYGLIGHMFTVVLADLEVGKTESGAKISCYAINRTRLYGNMSDVEIMDTLKAKYPQPMTNRSLALMAGELRSIGLSDLGVVIYAKALTVKPGEDYLDDTIPNWRVLEERWYKLLDDQVDMQVLINIQNVYLSDSEARSNPFVIQTRDMFVKLFGASIGSDGLLQFNLEKVMPAKKYRSYV